MSDVQTLALKPATQSVPRLEQFARQVEQAAPFLEADGRIRRRVEEDMAVIEGRYEPDVL